MGSDSTQGAAVHLQASTEYVSLRLQDHESALLNRYFLELLQLEEARISAPLPACPLNYEHPTQNKCLSLKHLNSNLYIVSLVNKC